MKEKKKFKVIECGGTGYEIGKQYGSACKESITKSISSLYSSLAYMNNASKEEIIAKARKHLPLVESLDPELIETLKGQAEGAGVTFDEVFALRCQLELSIYYQRIMALCTCFAATGTATRGGKTIIGQTFDLMKGMTMDLVKVKRADGLEQLSLVFWGACELTLNSAGIGMVLNVLPIPIEEHTIQVPCCCVIPKAMRQKNIGDALGVFCASGRSLLNYILASGEGDIVQIETRPDDFNVLYPERDMLVHTNHYLTDRFKRAKSPFALMEGGSHIRLLRARKIMEKYHGDITVERMMEMLSDHTDYPDSICAHPCQFMPVGGTLSAIIMVPEDKVAYITHGNPCEYEFMEYKL